jgi:hypothetical protein
MLDTLAQTVYLKYIIVGIVWLGVMLGIYGLFYFLYFKIFVWFLRVIKQVLRDVFTPSN